MSVARGGRGGREPRAPAGTAREREQPGDEAQASREAGEVVQGAAGWRRHG